MAVVARLNDIYGMEAQDSCVAFLGAGGVRNTLMIVKAANSPTWLFSARLGRSTYYLEVV